MVAKIPIDFRENLRRLADDDTLRQSLTKKAVDYALRYPTIDACFNHFSNEKIRIRDPATKNSGIVIPDRAQIAGLMFGPKFPLVADTGTSK
jgi:hypothetical protein